MSWLSLASIALTAQAAPAPAAPPASAPLERIATTSGYVSGADDDALGTRIKLNDSALRFRLPRLSSDALEPYVQLLTSASQRGFAVWIRFDGTAGRADAASGTITYPICSISVGDVHPLGDEAANCPAVAPGARNASAALAEGLAAGGSHPEAAIRLLGDALSDQRLAPSLRAIALEARANAAGALAVDQEWAGEAYDRLMVAALADDRARLAIDPDNADAHHAVARDLTDLGALDEALAIYANIARRWPDESLRVATRTGAIWRLRGDYRRALAVLDDLAARSGRPEGMRFAYHRAWTLVMLERYRDAIAELDIGLHTQPDYPSAYELRSCAQAQLGEIAGAIADEERALELLDTYARNREADGAESAAQARRLLTALRATRGRASAETLDLACRVPWRNWTRTRPRSALLPAAGS